MHGVPQLLNIPLHSNGDMFQDKKVLKPLSHVDVAGDRAVYRGT